MATSKHYSHLTLEMGKSIENYVIEGRTLAYMASEIGVGATSISRELKRNRRCERQGRIAGSKMNTSNQGLNNLL